METIEQIAIVYDKECPLCASYFAWTELQKRVQNVELINARDDHPLVKEMIDQGFNLDDGMVVKLHGQYYYGDEALHLLSSLTNTSAGPLNFLFGHSFAHKPMSKLFYPLFRASRNAALKIKGVGKIHQ